ncbi:MAG: type II and III secretion system protein family protein [Alphaproteobacteria bacterium GM202ARS2]|nr:type II and III secretion system protein family protein [Alphaproteobacteria bacterium GM202ARS2]
MKQMIRHMRGGRGFRLGLALVLGGLALLVPYALDAEERMQPVNQQVIDEEIHILTPEDKELFMPLQPLLKENGNETGAGMKVMKDSPAMMVGKGDKAYDYKSIEVEVSRAIVVDMEQALSDIFIADPAIADVQVSSSQTFYVYGRQPGRTTVIGYGLNGEVVRIFDLQVLYHVTDLKKTISRLVPNSRIEVTSTPRGVMLMGRVNTPQESLTVRRLAVQYLESLGASEEMLIDNVVVQGPNQVNLQVRVAEVSRDVGDMIGVNLEASLPGSRGRASFGSGRDFRVPLGTDTTGTTDQLRNTAATILNRPLAGDSLDVALRSQQGQNFLLGFFGSWGALYAMLDLLEEENLVTTLARPNLTSVSGETASFLAGGEVGVPSVGGGAAGAVVIEFRPFGVSLEFTPTILSSGRISLRLDVAVSNLSASNATTADGLRIPGFTTRRATTTVDVASGQSFAIAGLLQSDVNNSVDQHPFLANIPILGALFRSDSFRRRESELVIIVTPLVVEPVVADELRTPQDGTNFNSQIERLLTGRLFERHGEEQDEDNRETEQEQGAEYLDIGGFMVK